MPDVHPTPLKGVFDGKGIAQGTLSRAHSLLYHLHYPLVACSETHVLFLSDTAEVWAVGENNYGQVPTF